MTMKIPLLPDDSLFLFKNCLLEDPSKSYPLNVNKIKATCL